MKKSIILLVSFLCLGIVGCQKSTEKKTKDTVQSEAIISKQDTTTYKEETISVASTTGDYQIPAVVTIPNEEGPYPLVVMNHGFAGNKDEGSGFVYIARQLADNGIASVRMDFNGTGDSKEDFIHFSLDSAVKDSTDSLQHVLKNYSIDQKNLGIFGYSNGGREAIIMTNQDKQPFKARVLLAPGLDGNNKKNQESIETAEKEGYNEISWFGSTLHVGKEFYQNVLEFSSNLPEFSKPSIPTLVIYGTEDQLVPSENIDRFVKKSDSNLLTIHGAGHDYGFYANDEEGFNTIDSVSAGTVSFFIYELTDKTAGAMFSKE